MTSTQKLLEALREADAPAELIARAERGEFHDFDSQSATPIHDLVNACRAAGLEAIAKRAINGDFDSTRAEAEAWASGPEGRALFSRVFGREIQSVFVKGEVAQDIQSGLLCHQCGGYIDGESPGHPRRCTDCTSPIGGKQP